MTQDGYNRNKAVEYAHTWAYRRNPRYLDFSRYGGDCTNFISQCLHVGGAKMNYQDNLGWYYRSASDRSAAWTGADYLYKFLINNKKTGPFGKVIQLNQVQPGDIIQMSFFPDIWSHSVIVVDTGRRPNPDNVLVATHTDDCYNKAISQYNYLKMRCININAIK